MFSMISVHAAPTDTAGLRAYTFGEYTGEFNKVYVGEEAAERAKIFGANVEKIIAHNADPQWTYKLGVNKFADMTSTEFKAYYRGYSKDHMHAVESRGAIAVPNVCGGPKAINDTFDGFPIKSVSLLPASVDWRTKNVVTPVKDQGGCGSCWAFSTVETVESNVAIETGKLLTLSPQEIVSCAKNPSHCGGTGGCQGSTQWLGFNYTIGAGLVTESTYPYEGSTGVCRTAKTSPPAIGIKGCVRLPANNYTILMNAVATVGPISISAAAEPWQLYSSGVFNGACGADVDHAIQAVGYGTSGSDTYWLVRNSWGSGWGEEGYIRIKRTGLKRPCALDTTPADGTGCTGGPSTMNVCGLCGMLSDSSYVTGGFVAADASVEVS